MESYMVFIYDFSYMVVHMKVSYSELGNLISQSTGWTLQHVMSRLIVRLYCSVNLRHPNGHTRTFWSTDTRYPYLRGQRRDMVQISMTHGRIAVAQLVAFIEMESLPTSTVPCRNKPLVLVRWMSASRLSRNHQRDLSNRPVCEYPLSANHCLYQWSDVGGDRRCLLGLTRVTDSPYILEQRKMWEHFPTDQRFRAIQSETRAFYDVVQFDSIIDHANIAVDPSTGHMLQTIQMI